MHLTGSVVSLDSLLFVDLPRIDAAAHTFEKRDLKAVAPTQSDPDSLKKNLQSGEWVLRSYAPKIPMVTYYKKQWVFSPQALEIAPKGLIERAEKRFSLTTIAAIDQADNAVAEKQRAIQTDKEKMIHDLRQMFVFVQIKKQDEIRRDRPTGIYHRDPMAPHSAPFGPPNDYIVDKVLTNIANESMINSYTFPGEAMWHSACTEHYFLESSFPWYDFKYCFNVQYEFSQWITNYHYKHTSAAYWAIRNAPEPEPEKPSEYALNGSPKIDRWVQVRLIDEDGKALPNKDYKIYPKHNRKSALFSGTTDKDGLSERIILGHAFERVQVVFLEDQDANIAESDSIDWTERVIDVPVLRPERLRSQYAWEQYNGLAKKLDKVVFVTFSASIFGYDIPVDAYGALYDDLNNQAVKNPDIVVTKKITDGGYDTDKNKILIGKELVDKSLEDKELESAKLLHILLEEYGEHIEYLLRNEYSDVTEPQDETRGWGEDEGAKFAFALPNVQLEKVQEINIATYESREGDQPIIVDNAKTYEKLISVKDKERLIQKDGVSVEGRYKYFSAGRGEKGNPDSYGHQSLEDELAGHGVDDPEDRLEIYFGNWLRDYSQIIDSKVLELDLNNIQKSLESLIDKKASEATSTNVNDANKAVQKHLTRKSLTEIVAILAEDEFAPIYIGENRESDAFKIDEKLLGVYLPSEHLDNPKGIQDTESDPQFRKSYKDSEGEIDPDNWYKNYFKESIAYTKNELKNAVSAGDTPKGRVHFGQALHVLEDFYSHSNFCELLLHRIKKDHPNTEWQLPRRWTKSQLINGKTVFPLVTGTFGGVDTIVSFLSILEKIMDTPIDCDNPDENNKMYRISMILLKDYDLEVADTIESIVKYKKMIPGVNLCFAMKWLKSYIHETIAFFAQKTLAELPLHQAIDGDNPTHSQVGKDHDDNPLHILAAKNAQIMLRGIGELMRGSWDDKSKAVTLVKSVDHYMVHPQHIDFEKSIEAILEIYALTKDWAQENPAKLLAASRYEGDIDHAKEVLEDLSKESKKASQFILDSYSKYGQ